MQRRHVFYDKHVGVHLSLHLLSNVLDLALTVHGQKVQLLVYELQSVLTVLLGLKAVDPTQTQKHTHTCKQTHTHTQIFRSWVHIKSLSTWVYKLLLKPGPPLLLRSNVHRIHNAAQGFRYLFGPHCVLLKFGLDCGLRDALLPTAERTTIHTSTH